MGLLRAGAPVLASPANNLKRKLQWTQECVGMQDYRLGDFWVGVNTLTPNRLLKAAFTAGRLEWSAGYDTFTPEKRYGNSRIDACLTRSSGELPALWVECKNVTMVEDDVACFPDAVTERGQKHLREMIELVRQGQRAALFYLIQRADGTCFGPADVVDPAYSALFWEAVDAGVEMYPHRAIVTEHGIDLGPLLPLVQRSC